MISQLFLTFFISLFCYSILIVINFYDSIVNVLAQTIFIGTIFTILTMMVCFAVGLPIRFKNNIRRFWEDYYLSPFFAVISIIVMYLSSLPSLRIQVLHYDIYIKALNPYLATIGWFFFVFSVLHYFPKDKQTI